MRPEYLRPFIIALSVVLIWWPAVVTAQELSVVTTPDSDYPGFDLRSERDVSFEECQSTCLEDKQCRAFTYVQDKNWCFLKSDHGVAKPLIGAVAGRIAPETSSPVLQDPPSLGFLPDYLSDEVRLTKALVARPDPNESRGLYQLTELAAGALGTGDYRVARDGFLAALKISPLDPDLWTGLSRAARQIDPEPGESRFQIQQIATSAARIAYGESRTTETRASALAALAAALEARNLHRPALEAYKASLELVSSAEVRAAYESLRDRHGFRVVNHSVDNDSVPPRACVQFSEPLVRSGIDYASYVRVNAATATAVEATDQQICAEGLTHGQSYSITFRQGLPSSVGEILEQPVTINVYVRDRTPAVRFTGDNFVLPSTGRHGIPLVSVNTERAEIELFRVGDRSVSKLLSGQSFLRQLEGYRIDEIRNELGAPVWKGSLEISTRLNKEVTTSFSVDEVVPERTPGVYVLTAVPAGQQSRYWDAIATQWFVISDIGISTFSGEDGLNVFVRSLATAKPLGGLDLQLLARNNEVLGSAVTDATGRAHFAPGLVRGKQGMAPVTVLARNGNGDFVLLDLTRAGFDLSDRGVVGRNPPGPIDVFSWTERGIYRLGETVHASALMRDASAKAVTGLPLTFIFLRPDGVEDRRIVSAGDRIGGQAAAYDLQPNAMRGTWSVRMHTDVKSNPVAEMRFLVEDFVPDRLEFDLSASTKEISPGLPTSVTVDARYLYGAPAADLDLEGSVRITPEQTRDDFPGYQFGLAEEQIEPTLMTLESLPVLDQQGQAEVPVLLTSLPSTTQPLSANVAIRVREPGGRAVERNINLPVTPQGVMIGIRPEAGKSEIPENSTARFRVIAVSDDGNRQNLTGLRWRLTRLERHYQWYRTNDRGNFEPVDVTRDLLDGTVDAAVDTEASIAVPVAWGRYRLEVTAPGNGGTASSVEFSAGWVVETASLDSPDALEVALDQESYRAGDTARLTVSARSAGEVLVTVGTDRLIDVMSASVSAGDTVIAIPVRNGWGAGAYVTATHLRPGNAAESRLPARAIGVKWLQINPAPNRIDVSLDVPELARPRGPLEIPVRLSGLAAGEAAFVTVAAVDVGILNLTRYEPPEPTAWYFGQRKMGLEIRDLYGRLIDGSLGVAGRIRSGGDAAGLEAEGSPPTQPLLALFSGPVQVDRDGRTTVTFDLPQFNGTARLMAVAWSADRIGSATGDVIIRDPVVVLASAPKVMAPGDASRLHLEITETDGTGGNYFIQVDAGDELQLDTGLVPNEINLTAGGSTSLSLPLSATSIGNGILTIRVVDPDSGDEFVQALSVLVRPATQPVSRRQTVALGGNGGSFILDETVLDGLHPNGASVTMDVSRARGIDTASVLAALDRYPYGCTEQITSRALPLLYLSEFSTLPALEDPETVRKRVHKAIYPILANQSSAGGFGLWSPGQGELWLDSYVVDFLTRAREKGYIVREEAMLAALENLQNVLAYEQDLKDRGSSIAYALYVLARNRRASVGDLRYYADTRLEEFDSAMARAHVGAALALYGDAERSNLAFQSALEKAREDTDRQSYADFGSDLRDAAAMLALASETRPLPQSIPAMVNLVSARAETDRYTSTQENAWLLLAARGLKQADSTLQLSIAGREHTGAFSLTRAGEDVAVMPVEIINRGGEPVTASINVLAAPLSAPLAGGDGFTIGRTYYTLEGAEANLGELAQNTRLVVVLRVVHQNDWPARVLVNDPLPGGFEIDNPKLVASADLKAFDWLEEPNAAHSEFRADRFVAAFDARGKARNEFIAAYVVRAVSPGEFTHPAAVVEDMYRPQYIARSGEGRLQIVPASR